MAALNNVLPEETGHSGLRDRLCLDALGFEAYLSCDQLMIDPKFFSILEVYTVHFEC